MLSLLDQEALHQALKDISVSAKALVRLTAQLNAEAQALSQVKESLPDGQESIAIDANEAAHLLQLNRHLVKMETFLTAAATELTHGLSRKLAHAADPIHDFEIDAVLRYILRETDAEWSDNSDNFLTSRELSLKHQLERFTSGADYRMPMPCMKAVNTEPHCWSFHELFDHEYGLTNPRLPLRDCLRLGSVHMEVVIRQQYQLNLDTGEWNKQVGSLQLPE